MKKILKKGKATGMDMLPAEEFIHGGETLSRQTLDMFNEIKDSVTTPDQWNEVGLTPIYKNKGILNILSGLRM